MKLRGSVSKSGNVNLGAYSLDPTDGVAGGFPYGSLPGFTASSSVNNPGIKPEFVNSKEVGFELSILKNRISLEATAYTQDNSNQILSIQISRSTGYSSSLVNAANFTNKGVEFDLKLTPLVSLGALKLNVKTNFTLQDSKVNSVYEGLNEVGIGNGNFAITGYPAFMFKLTDYNRDTEGRVIVDAKTGYPSQNPTPVMFGRTMPKYIFGVNPSFEYKNFTLTVTADTEQVTKFFMVLDQIWTLQVSLQEVGKTDVCVLLCLIQYTMMELVNMFLIQTCWFVLVVMVFMKLLLQTGA